MEKKRFCFLVIVFLSLCMTTVLAQKVQYYPTHQIVNGERWPADDPRECLVEVDGNECTVWYVTSTKYIYAGTYREIPSSNGYRVFQCVDGCGNVCSYHIHIYEDFSLMYIVNVCPGNGYTMKYYRKK
jgi:hypothetical protein